MPHIVSSALVYCVAVAAVEWNSAAACFGIDPWASRVGAVVVDVEGVGDVDWAAAVAAESATEAVAMERRERTRSRGYVEPVDTALKCHLN